jgi:FixJ family two-component response regulator
MSEATVYIVDDDDTARAALRWLMESAGLQSEAFESAAAFLSDYHPGQPGCLVVDIRMPGMDGLELLDRIRAHGIVIPAIVVTAYGSVPAAVRAFDRGAVDFLEKPFDGETLLHRVEHCLHEDRRARSQENAASRARLDALTAPERQVLERLLAGNSSRDIALALDVAPRTIDRRFRDILRKTGARDISDLARIAVQAGRARANGPPENG